MTFYAADGSWNVTVVTGNDLTGSQAPDGSTYITGSTGTGYYHPCGAIAATSSLDDVWVNRQAPDGSLYVNSTGLNNGSQKVTFISGSL